MPIPTRCGRPGWPSGPRPRPPAAPDARSRGPDDLETLPAGRPASGAGGSPTARPRPRPPRREAPPPGRPRSCRPWPAPRLRPPAGARPRRRPSSTSRSTGLNEQRSRRQYCTKTIPLFPPPLAGEGQGEGGRPNLCSLSSLEGSGGRRRILVEHLHQRQPASRGGPGGAGPVASGEDVGDPTRRLPAGADLRQRPRDPADQAAQEPLPDELELDEPVVALDRSRTHLTDPGRRRFRGRAEGRPVVRAHERWRRSSPVVEVEPPPHVPAG